MYKKGIYIKVRAVILKFFLMLWRLYNSLLRLSVGHYEKFLPFVCFKYFRFHSDLSFFYLVTEI